MPLAFHHLKEVIGKLAIPAAVGHPTLRLVRVGIGPLELGGLKPGRWRDLTPGELDALHAMLYARKPR